MGEKVFSFVDVRKVIDTVTPKFEETVLAYVPTMLIVSGVIAR